MSKNTEKRRKEILSMVNDRGTISVSDIAARFPDLSEVTLRKDLKYLHENQQLVCTHGGAKSIPSAFNYYFRSNFNLAEKKEVARKAADLIREMDSVFISAGTTCSELAKMIPEMPLHICSDGIYTISNIPNHPEISVEILGGDLDMNAMRVEGLSALDKLDSMHFNICFISTLSIHPELGFSHYTAMTTAILGKVIEHSDRVVVLADSKKFNSSFTQFRIPIECVNTVVTDSSTDESFIASLRAKNIEVI